MSTGTDVATTNGNTNAAVAPARPTTLKEHLMSDQFKQQLAAALPRHCTPDRMARVAMTAMIKTPKLADCDQRSFFSAMLDLAKWGLEPDGRHAHLIPFNNRKLGIVECQLILDYKGIVQLLYRTGQVSTVHADVVYSGDLFEYSMGTVDKHVPWWMRGDAAKPDAKGEIIGAYVRVVMKNGAIKCEVMPKEDIDSVRGRSKAKNSGPWVTDYAEMAKKTVFRRASKWLPVSAEIVEAFDRDYDAPAFTVDALSHTPQQEPPKGLSDLADNVLGAEEPEEAGMSETSDGDRCLRCGADLLTDDEASATAIYDCGTQVVGGTVARVGADCTPPGEGKLFESQGGDGLGQ